MMEINHRMIDIHHYIDSKLGEGECGGKNPHFKAQSPKQLQRLEIQRKVLNIKDFGFV